MSSRNLLTVLTLVVVGMLLMTTVLIDATPSSSHTRTISISATTSRSTASFSSSSSASETESHSVSFSPTQSQSVSTSATKTHSKRSPSASQTRSATTSMSQLATQLSSSMSPISTSSTSSHSHTYSPSDSLTATISESRSITSVTPMPTQSRTATDSASSLMTASVKSPTATSSLSATTSPLWSESESTSATPSGNTPTTSKGTNSLEPTMTVSPSSFPSRSSTESSTRTTITPPPTKTATRRSPTVSPSQGHPSRSQTSSVTGSTSPSPSATHTTSSSLTPLVASVSSTHSSSSSWMPTSSFSLSSSFSRGTLSPSRSSEQSQSRSPSKSQGTPSPSASSSGLPSLTHSPSSDASSTPTRTRTPPPTKTNQLPHTASETPQMSNTRTASWTMTGTPTSSPSSSMSETETPVTSQSTTRTTSPSVAPTNSFSLSSSFSRGTLSPSRSSEQSQSRSPSKSQGTPSPSASNSGHPSLTHSPSSDTSSTPTPTQTPPPTKTNQLPHTASETLQMSETRSVSLVKSDTTSASFTPSFSRSTSISISHSFSSSATSSPTAKSPSLMSSMSTSRSYTTSASRSTSPSASESHTAVVSTSWSRSPSAEGSLSRLSYTPSVTQTVSSSITQSSSFSTTLSTTGQRSFSRSPTATVSVLTGTIQPSISHTQSSSETLSLTTSSSKSPSISVTANSITDDSSRTDTLSITIAKFTETHVMTGTRQKTRSNSTSRTRNTISDMLSMSPTATRSGSSSVSREDHSESKTSTFSSSPSAMPSWTQSGSNSASETSSHTHSETVSPMSLSRDPSVTHSFSESTSPTTSASLSLSVSLSGSSSQSRSTSTTASVSLSESSSSSRTPSSSVTPTDSESITSLLSVSETQNVTKTSSPTKSFSTSMSETASVTPDRSVSNSLSGSESDTTPMSSSESLSPTRSTSQSWTSSVSLSASSTHSATVETSATRSQSPSSTMSMSKSSSLSPTISRSLSESTSSSATASISVTLTTSASLTSSSSWTVSTSATLSGSASLTSSSSWTVSTSATLSGSASLTSSSSWTVSTSTTETMSPTTSVSRSQTITVSESSSATPSLSQALSVSVSRSSSLSQSFDVSATHSLTVTSTKIITPSSTLSFSASESDSFSGSVSCTDSHSSSVTVTLSYTLTGTQDPTESGSQTRTMTDSVSRTITFTRTSSRSLSKSSTASVMPPTTSHIATRSRSLPAQLCNNSCVNGYCLQNPIWPNSFYCKCFASPLLGYWDGGSDGGPCVTCKYGYYGKTCTLQCAGGACSVCSGHGSCNGDVKGDGSCVCTTTTTAGFWDGPSCNLCQAGYFGLRCESACRCTRYGSCDEGRLGSGNCTCTFGWYGQACEFCDPHVLLDSCSNSIVCPGPSSNPCNGHGVCNRIPLTLTGNCTCFPNWGGPNCDSQCPNLCSNQGVCHSGAEVAVATCECLPRRTGADCSGCLLGYWGVPGCGNICPGGVEQPCSLRGNCSIQTGVCSCSFGYGGPACEAPCPVDPETGKVCGSHGVCEPSTGLCRCYADTTRGFWNGTLCSECWSFPQYAGSSCTLPCPTLNGAVCNKQGYCDATTALCLCFPGTCGRVCDVNFVNGACPSCAPGRYGADCAGVCQCQHGGHCDSGVSGTGACDCTNTGYAGTTCTIPCLADGLGRPCSGNGTCNLVNGACLCYSGFGGSICNLKCPHATCHDHGVCSDGASGNGTCTCSPGYVWPENGCEFSCNCTNGGTCVYPNQTCVCIGNFTGPTCAACVPHVHGVGCNLTCVNGNTVGTSCVCRFGWGGADCSVLCPTTSNGGVCNGQGTCLSNGACLCSQNVFGATCNCTDAVCARDSALKTCDTATGQCICQARRTGAGCIECIFGYFGPTCSFQCSCNGRGTCDSTTGACTCFDNSVRGFWSGASCTQCKTGYMGINCDQSSNDIARPPDLVYKIGSTSEVLSYLTMYGRKLYCGGFFHAHFDVVDSQTAAPVAYTMLPWCGAVAWFRVLPPNFFPPLSARAPESVTEEVALYVYTPHAVTCKTTNVTGVYVSPLSRLSIAQSPPFYLLQRSVLFDQIGNEITDVAQFVVVDVASFVLCAIAAQSVVLCCTQLLSDVSNPTKQANGIGFMTIAAVKHSPFFSSPQNMFLQTPSLWIAGLDLASRACAVRRVLMATTPVRDNSMKQPFTLADIMPDTIISDCRAIQCVDEVDQTVFVVYDASEASYLAAYNLSSMERITPVALGPPGKTCSTITYDVTSNIGFVSIGTLVVKFEVSVGNRSSSAPPPSSSSGVVNTTSGNNTTTTSQKKLVAYGQLTINVQLGTFVIDDALGIAYGSYSSINGVRVARFLFLETNFVSPTYAVRAGGTKITATGKGLERALRPLSVQQGAGVVLFVSCSLGGVVLQGSASVLTNNNITEGGGFVLSSTGVSSVIEVICTTPRLISSSVCVPQNLELSLDGISFTSNQLVIQRPREPILVSAFPTTTMVLTPVMVTLVGRALVSTPYIRCRFYDPMLASNANSSSTTSGGNNRPPLVEYYETPANVSELESKVFCMSPNVSYSWSGQSVVQISLDAQVYTSNAMPFVIYGPPAGFIMETPTSTVTSSLHAVFNPPIQLSIVDASENRLLLSDMKTWNATVVPPLALANVTFGLHATCTAGTCLFKDLSMSYPQTGSFAFSVRIDEQPGWGSRKCDVAVLQGSMAAITVLSPPFVRVSGASQGIVYPGSLPPGTTTLALTDSAKNSLINVAGTVLTVTMYVVDPETNRIDFSKKNQTQHLPRVVFSANGLATFSSVLNPQFGYLYTIMFALEVNPAVNVTTEPFGVSCDKQNEFQVVGETVCRPCDTTTATCNGTLTHAPNPGYWRAASSIVVYSCSIPSACLGDGCATGYTGLMCSACSSGYAKNYEGMCSLCPNFGVAAFTLGVVIFALYVILLLVVVVACQYASRTRNRVGSAVVVVLILLSYLQMLGLMGNLSFLNLPSMFSQVLGAVSMVTDFRVYRMHVAYCLLAHFDLNALHLFIIYLVGFTILVPLVALTAWLILRRWPGALMREKHILKREKEYRKWIAVDIYLKMKQEKKRSEEMLTNQIKEDGVLSLSHAVANEPMYIKGHQPKALLLVSFQAALLVIYQTTALTALEIFNCNPIDVGLNIAPLLVMNADHSVLCSRETNTSYSIIYYFAGLALAVFTVMVPLATTIFAMVGKRYYADEDFKAYTAVFTFGIRDRAVYWTAILFIRRSMQIAALTFLAPRIATYVYMWLAILMLVIQTIISPWRVYTHSLLERAAVAMIAILVNMSLLFSIPSLSSSTTLIQALDYGVTLLAMSIPLLFAWNVVAFSVKTTIARERAKRTADPEDDEPLPSLEGIVHDDSDGAATKEGGLTRPTAKIQALGIVENSSEEEEERREQERLENKEKRRKKKIERAKQIEAQKQQMADERRAAKEAERAASSKKNSQPPAVDALTSEAKKRFTEANAVEKEKKDIKDEPPQSCDDDSKGSVTARAPAVEEGEEEDDDVSKSLPIPLSDVPLESGVFSWDLRTTKEEKQGQRAALRIRQGIMDSRGTALSRFSPTSTRQRSLSDLKLNYFSDRSYSSSDSEHPSQRTSPVLRRVSSVSVNTAVPPPAAQLRKDDDDDRCSSRSGSRSVTTADVGFATDGTFSDSNLSGRTRRSQQRERKRLLLREQELEEDIDDFIVSREGGSALMTVLEGKNVAKKAAPLAITRPVQLTDLISQHVKQQHHHGGSGENNGDDDDDEETTLSFGRFAARQFAGEPKVNFAMNNEQDDDDEESIFGDDDDDEDEESNAQDRRRRRSAPSPLMTEVELEALRDELGLPTPSAKPSTTASQQPQSLSGEALRMALRQEHEAAAARNRIAALERELLVESHNARAAQVIDQASPTLQRDVLPEAYISRPSVGGLKASLARKAASARATALNPFSMS